jgi:hypothetical protein
MLLEKMDLPDFQLEKRSKFSAVDSYSQQKVGAWEQADHLPTLTRHRGCSGSKWSLPNTGLRRWTKWSFIPPTLVGLIHQVNNTVLA